MTVATAVAAILPPMHAQPRRRPVVPAALLVLSVLASCASRPSFREDLAFLQQHRETLVLTAPDGSGKVAVVPEFQGRVMTSTIGDGNGMSHGFLKYDRIAARDLLPGMNPYGGEDRFWLGPEGGPFSLFFAPGKEQVIANWQTPAPIDSEPFALAGLTGSSARFTRRAQFTNASGTRFDVGIEREVVVLDATATLVELGAAPDELQVVAFESRNTVTNRGDEAWRKRSGLLSIWVLGMFPPGDSTTVVVPLALAGDQPLGSLVNDSYFGKVPGDRLLRVLAGPALDLPARRSALLFRADGQLRSKIGVRPEAALGVMGSWDADQEVLTIVTHTLPPQARDYVNSTWGAQEQPYGGDALNSYNDGPTVPGGAPFGPFYELESSSPAAELAPGESLRHVHRTVHLTGSREALDAVARTVLGVSLDEVEQPSAL